MSESTPESKPRFLDRLRISTPAWGAIGVGLCLLVIAIVTWSLRDWDSQRLPWTDAVHWTTLLAAVGLWLTTCCLTYLTLRFWGEDLPASIGSLERSWSEGQKVVERQGLDSLTRPIYLMMGCHERETQKRILQGFGVRLVHEPTPISGGVMHWFLADDAIWLCCSEIGGSAVAQSRVSLHHRETVASDRFELDWQQNINESSVETVDGGAEEALRTQSTQHRERFIASRSEGHDVPSTGGAATQIETISAPAQDNGPLYQRMLGQLDQSEDWIQHSMEMESEILGATSASASVELLTSHERMRLHGQLREFCRRLRTWRHGIVPINGIIIALDATKVATNEVGNLALGSEVGRDLDLLSKELGVEAPTMILLHGMEKVDGFAEFTRRAGQDALNKVALGESFPVQRNAHGENAILMVRRATRKLLHLAYGLLTHRDSNGQNGNRGLFRLVMNLRGRFEQSLEHFIESLVHSAGETNAMFCGVYFVATGEDDANRGFGKGAMARLRSLQSEVNWTGERIRSEKTTQRAIRVVQVVLVVLGVALIVGCLL
jgi:hypothetical protein